MCYDDFVNEFEKIEMCALGPQSLNMDESRKKVAFEMTLEHGGWQPGVNAGGCRNFLGGFHFSYLKGSLAKSHWIQKNWLV